MNPLSAAGGVIQGLIGGLIAATTSANKFQATLQVMTQAGNQVANSFAQVAQAGLQAGGAAKTMFDAFQILLQAIGTAFTPVLFQLSIWFLRLSDLVIQKLVPAIQEWMKYLAASAKIVLIFAKALLTAKAAETGASLGSVFGPVGRLLGGLVGLTTGAQLGENLIGDPSKMNFGFGRTSGPETDEQLQGRRDDIERGRLVLQEMRMNLGRQGQVGFSGIADVWKQVQMKSFMSPFEQMQLKYMQQQIDIAERTLARMSSEYQDAQRVSNLGKEFGAGLGMSGHFIR